MTLQGFRDLLLTVTDKVYHFEAYQEVSGQYIIWQEIGARANYGSGCRQDIVKRIQVDLYTEDEFNSVLEELMQVLENADVAFEGPETIYDKDAKCIRHILSCEVI